MNDKTRKGRAGTIALRALAGILIVAMLGTVLLYRRTNVAIDISGLENRGARYAAEQLTAGELYAGAPRLRRMGIYAQSFLRGLSTSEDCDRAAQIAIAQADFESAAAYTERAIELCDGADRETLAVLNTRIGYLYTLREDYKSALKWLDKGLTVVESPEARLTRAQVRLNLGDPQGALDDLQVFLEGTDSPWQMLPNIVNIYEAAGEYDAAVACYTALIEATDEPEYMLDRAYCYTSLGRMADAVGDCERYAAAGGTEAAQAQVMLGLGWMREGGYDEAGECFAKALAQEYPDPEALYYYVVLCAYVTGDDARACRYGDDMVARIRDGGQARAAQVQMEDATGRLSVSLAPLDEASLCMMTGASHMRLEQYDPAVSCLTMCLERSPKDGFARYLRASSLLAARRFEEAIGDFDAAIAAGEDEERCRYGRAICRSQLGDVDGALDDFDWVVLNGTDESLFSEASRLMQALMGDAGGPGAPEAEAAPAAR